jgi:hypothetical protein
MRDTGLLEKLTEIAVSFFSKKIAKQLGNTFECPKEQVGHQELIGQAKSRWRGIARQECYRIVTMQPPIKHSEEFQQSAANAPPSVGSCIEVSAADAHDLPRVRGLCPG